MLALLLIGLLTIAPTSVFAETVEEAIVQQQVESEVSAQSDREQPETGEAAIKEKDDDQLSQEFLPSEPTESEPEHLPNMIPDGKAEGENDTQATQPEEILPPQEQPQIDPLPEEQEPSGEQDELGWQTARFLDMEESTLVVTGVLDPLTSETWISFSPKTGGEYVIEFENSALQAMVYAEPSSLDPLPSLLESMESGNYLLESDKIYYLCIQYDFTQQEPLLEIPYIMHIVPIASNEPTLEVGEQGLMLSGVLEPELLQEDFSFTAVLSGSYRFVVQREGEGEFPALQLYARTEDGEERISLTDGQAELQLGKQYFIRVVCEQVAQPFNYSIAIDYLPSVPSNKQEMEFQNGDVIFLPVTGHNIQSFESKTITITYDASKLDLLSTAAHTQDTPNADGVIEKAQIKILSQTDGKLVLACIQEIPEGKEWSGLITLASFQALENGTSYIEMSIQ